MAQKKLTRPKHLNSGTYGLFDGTTFAFNYLGAPCPLFWQRKGVLLSCRVGSRV
jgi:hypothetical protein